MRAVVISAVFSWIALCTELAMQSLQAWPLHLPQGSLVIPLACAMLFWFGSATGIAISSALVLLNWIARPVGLPVVGLVLPLAAALIFGGRRRLASSAATAGFGNRRRYAVPRPLQLPAFTLLLVALDLSAGCLPALQAASLPELTASLTAWGAQLLQMSLIVLPLSAAASFLLIAADELGLRRHASHDFLRST